MLAKARRVVGSRRASICARSWARVDGMGVADIAVGARSRSGVFRAGGECIDGALLRGLEVEVEVRPKSSLREIGLRVGIVC